MPYGWRRMEPTTIGLMPNGPPPLERADKKELKIKCSVP